MVPFCLGTSTGSLGGKQVQETLFDNIWLLLVSCICQYFDYSSASVIEFKYLSTAPGICLYCDYTSACVIVFVYLPCVIPYIVTIVVLV